MTKIQNILQEINQLEPEELEVILKEVLKKIEESHRIESILNEYIGIGEGVWETDAQEYVNKLREEDDRVGENQ